MPILLGLYVGMLPYRCSLVRRFSLDRGTLLDVCCPRASGVCGVVVVVFGGALSGSSTARFFRDGGMNEFAEYTRSPSLMAPSELSLDELPSPSITTLTKATWTVRNTMRMQRKVKSTEGS